MTITTADLVSDCERFLLAGDRDELNALGAAVSDTTGTTFTFKNDLLGITQGAYIALDLEICYVWSTSESAKQATVQRGMLNTTPATHANGSLVYVNPKFSKYDMLKAINVELGDLAPELFQVKSFTLTSQPVQWTYTVPVGNTDILDILEIRYQPPDPTFSWPKVRRRDFQLLRNMPTTGDGGFSSGMGIRIESPLYPGRPMTVRYGAPFTPLVDLTDDAAATTGMPVGSLDIPPLGAAARLMGVREAKRTFLESTMDTRRASEVPVGAAGRAAALLISLVEARIRSEVETLRQAWPEEN
jgi:hypothetical protein